MNQADARRTPEKSRIRRSTCQSVRKPTAAGDTCSAHHRSVSTTAAQRPPNSRAVAAPAPQRPRTGGGGGGAIAAAGGRPRGNGGLGAAALPREPADDLAAI